MASSSIETTLSNYTWQNIFQDGTQGKLKFFPDHFVSLHPGGQSNGKQSQFAVTTTGTDSTIKFGPWTTTLMMPDPQGQAREKVLSQTFKSEEEIPFTLDLTNTFTPTLIIGGNPNTLVFSGKMTPEAVFGVQPNLAFYDVGPSKSFPSGWRWRKVTYDDHYVKSEVAEWTEYTPGTIQDGERWENDDKHQFRVRVNEFVVDGMTKAIFNDMVVSSAVLDLDQEDEENKKREL